MIIRTFVSLLTVALNVWIISLYFSFVKFPIHEKGIIIITGASSGIGKHAAFSLLLNTTFDYDVFATVRKESDGEKLLEELKGHPKAHKLHPILMDVTNETSVELAFSTISQFMQNQNLSLVGIVNNAGIANNQPIEFMRLKAVKELFDVNVFGLMLATKHAVPLLRASHGRIVNVGSLGGIIASPYASNYASAKRAVESLTDSWRRELQRFQISVSIIEPGFIITPHVEKGWSNATKGNTTITTPTLNPIQSEFYENHYKTKDSERALAFSKAAGVDVTSEAILHALTAQYPYTRYPVAGAFYLTSSQWSLVSLLPDRIADWIVLLQMNV